MNDVSIVVVLFNSAAHVDALLDSLPAATAGVASWQLVVVDNGSADDGAARITARMPSAIVLRRENRGYGAGINAGLAAAQPSRAVLVINADIRLGSGSVAALLDGLDAAGAGITVPRLFAPDGTLGHSLRREPTVLRALGEAVLSGRAGRYSRLGEMVTDPAAYTRPSRADWASGCVMLISHACLDAVGPWDEGYFLYSEETDFALRARDAGFALQLVPAATAIHVGGVEDPTSRSLLAINRVRLFGRRHGTPHTVAFWAAVTLNEALRALLGRRNNRAALSALLRPLSWVAR